MNMRTSLIERLYRKLARTILRSVSPFLPRRVVQRRMEKLVVSIERGEVAVRSPNPVFYDVAFVERIRQNAYEQEWQPLKPFETWQLANVQLHTSNGVIIIDDKKLLLESMLKPIEAQEAAYYRHYIPKHSVRLQVPCTTISATFGHNYGHWFTDSLARLYIISQLQQETPLTLLVPDNLWPFQLRSLELCQPDNVCVEYVAANSWVHVNRLLLPSFIRNRTNGYLPVEILSFLRERILCGISNPDNLSRKRIYLSRSGIPRRQVSNEADVMACLSAYGFERYIPQDLSFDEQVNLFRQAEIVVSPYGSALTSTLFSDPIPVIEFKAMPPDDLFFWRLSQALGHQHHFVPATQRNRLSDMTVDVRALEQQLHGILD